MNKPKRYLVVDGDFFAHRSLHGIRSIDKNITLDSSEEMKKFHNAMINSVHSLYDVFKNEHHNLFDQLVFVFDHRSWRKNVKPHIPYYVEVTDKTEKEMGYKSNRKEDKDKSDINYENFELCKDQFREVLTQKNLFPIFFMPGCEGDDAMLLLKLKLLEKNIENKMIIFCTDGDLKQLLDENENTKPDSVILFRNIKSGSAPEGELVISKSLYDGIYGKQDIMTSFINATSGQGINYDEYKNVLFNVNFKDQSHRANYERKPGNGVSIATPYLTLLSKCILGDKKDNVFPIFRWKTKTGSQNRNVTLNHVISVMEKEMGMTFNEDNCKKIWNSKPDLTQLLFGLLTETKQDKEEKCDIQKVGKHFVHNRNILNITNDQHIPVDLISRFNLEFETKLELLDKYLTEEEVRSIKYETTDSTNILAQSLPDLPDDLKAFSDLLS